MRITDINYGNHLGNDKVLSIIHEARMLMLFSWNFSELDAGGSSLIMGDVMIAYKNEAFYGDQLLVEIFCMEMTGRSFDLLYKIKTKRGDLELDIAHAKTGMVCFDYTTRKISSIQKALKSRLTGGEI